MKKTEIIELLRQTNEFFKGEDKLYRVSQNLNVKNSEDVFFCNYSNLVDIVYMAFTGRTAEQRERMFCAPGAPEKGCVVAWIYRFKPKFKLKKKQDPKLRVSIEYFNKSGFIGDIIYDIIVDPKIEESKKYLMLKRFFTLQDKLLEESEPI